MIGLVVAGIAVATLVFQDRDEATSGSKRASEPSGDPAPLQDLIDARCREGGVVELSGRYVIDDTVVIQGCRNLTIQGNGALLETDQLGPFTNGKQAGGDGKANDEKANQDEEEEEEANDEQEAEQGGDRGNDQSGDQGKGKRQESKRVHVLIADSSDIVVRNLTVRGPNRTDDPKIGRPGVAVYDARYAKEHGFSIQGSSRVRLEDNRVEMVFGD
ncbi:MAG: hypothetical protein M3N32_10585, partial [Actinomycetota bacterium]|nr:hypothetical protein [Actinomycetota bacterium]